MMDHERQERDLQGVFDATQASYLASIENTFALQERTLQFARALIEPRKSPCGPRPRTTVPHFKH
jgi:hypothetical protein